MCRIPKIVIVAPSEHHQDLRKALGSLEYDIVATVDSYREAAEITCDVVVAWRPDDDEAAKLASFDAKFVAIGGSAKNADMSLDEGDASSFKSRIWELFRPAS